MASHSPTELRPGAPIHFKMCGKWVVMERADAMSLTKNKGKNISCPQGFALRGRLSEGFCAENEPPGSLGLERDATAGSKVQEQAPSL